MSCATVRKHVAPASLLLAGFLAIGVGLSSSARAEAQDPSTNTTPATQPASSHEEVEEPWLTPIQTPADPELEEQIVEVQDALKTIHQQMVRRKELINRTQEPAAQATLYSEVEALRQEREDLEALLHDLVDEARVSQQTAIDEALVRARGLERNQERQAQREELIRDRQQ